MIINVIKSVYVSAEVRCI